MVADQAEAKKRRWRKAGAGWEGAPTTVTQLTLDPDSAVAISWEVGTHFKYNQFYKKPLDLGNDV